MPQIGHVQIRNRGTIGGSLAHADPAGELPAVVAALEGELVLKSRRGERRLAPQEFFVGYLTTAVEPDELLVEARVPVTPPRTGTAFMEVSRRHGDFALVGVAATVTVDESGVCTACTVGVTGVGPRPSSRGSQRGRSWASSRRPMRSTTSGAAWPACSRPTAICTPPPTIANTWPAS